MLKHFKEMKLLLLSQMNPLSLRICCSSLVQLQSLRICRYLHYHSVGKKITDEITDGKSPLVNLSSVIFCSSISPLVIKKILLPMNLLMEKANKNKFHSIGNSLENKLYVIPSVII
jgi:hypothetical protein